MEKTGRISPRWVLAVGALLAFMGLGVIAYLPKDNPAVLAGSTAVVMLGYLLGRWAVHRMSRNGDQ